MECSKTVNFFLKDHYIRERMNLIDLDFDHILGFLDGISLSL